MDQIFLSPLQGLPLDAKPRACALGWILSPHLRLIVMRLLARAYKLARNF
jgi:hypothetical protein